MASLSPLARRFAHAGLPLELTAAPLVRGVGAEHIVQLDISRDRRRGERFLFWKGAPVNRLEAEGVDRDLRQLVLLVHEPARRFELELPRWASEPEGTRVVRRAGARRWVEQVTPGSKRHFLCGMDEAHLFIAELPRPVSTVRDAHRALQNPVVTALDRRAPARTIRQGEWFLVALDPREEEEVLALEPRTILQRRIGIAQAARLNRRGRPHVADEVLVAAQGPLRGNVYVRGAIRHPDHKTIFLHQWRRALGNSEPLSAPSGVSWVD